MTRITVAQLQAVIDRLNRETGSPAEPYVRDADGKNRAQIGNYHLSRAYGGFALHRMVTDGGGVSSPLHTGHIPARDLLNRMHAYLAGIDAARRP
jgi:hypothetical protein